MRSDGIPSQFQLLGHTIKVRVVSPSRWRHGKDTVGIWLPEQYRIDIVSTVKGSHRQQTWAHEAMHAMLDLGGYEALSTDEVLVDRLGHLLQQMLTTME
jgi:hypothetical protein